MNQEYAALIGFTQEKLESSLVEHIFELAAKESATHEQTLDKIRRWYNGYRFTKKTITVYNPVSTGKLFANRECWPA